MLKTIRTLCAVLAIGVFTPLDTFGQDTHVSAVQYAVSLEELRGQYALLHREYAANVVRHHQLAQQYAGMPEQLTALANRMARATREVSFAGGNTSIGDFFLPDTQLDALATAEQLFAREQRIVKEGFEVEVSQDVITEGDRQVPVTVIRLGNVMAWALSELEDEAWVSRVGVGLDSHRFYWELVAPAEDVAQVVALLGQVRDELEPDWLSLPVSAVDLSIFDATSTAISDMPPVLPHWQWQPLNFVTPEDCVASREELAKIIWQIKQAGLTLSLKTEALALLQQQAQLYKQTGIASVVALESSAEELYSLQAFYQQQAMYLCGEALPLELPARDVVVSCEGVLRDSRGEAHQADILYWHLGALAKSSDGRVWQAVQRDNGAGLTWAHAASEVQAQQWQRAYDAVESNQRLWIDVNSVLTQADVRRLAAPPENWFQVYMGKGGVLMWPLLCVGGLGMLWVFERIFVLYVLRRVRRNKVARVLAYASSGDEASVTELLHHPEGMVVRVLAACFAARDKGQEAMEDAIQAQLLHDVPGLHRGLHVIGMCAAVAPLIGLLGTVTGIIRTFAAAQAAGEEKQALMASGISEALLTTALGLMMAIPLLMAAAWLRGRSDRLMAHSEAFGARLLMILSHDMQKDTSAGGVDASSD